MLKMVYAVDSNVLIDVFTNDPAFADASIAALSRAAESGTLIACEIVFAETASMFPNEEAFRLQMEACGVRFSAMSESASRKAGAMWRTFLKRRRTQSRGTPRRCVVPDFLVGAHALECADALITRDRGFLRDYFKELKIVDPSISE